MKLDQFLKWKNLVSSGGEAKIHIKSGSVKVNGLIETRRGRKLNKGDKVMFLKNELIFE
jgi:ribosome-associated protein